jgi:arabinogalactan endo-1,4-beta-galactosidase
VAFFKLKNVKIFNKALIIAVALLVFYSCKKGTGTQPVPDPGPPLPPVTQFAKGADIGWLTEMEAASKKFYNASGTEQDLILILKNLGMNTIRLRVWVNPANGWNGKADVVAKAVRAKNLGMRVMIDFHYSDSWADPGQQTKPAAWASDITSLVTALSAHTIDVLNALKAAGVTPEWVQVGNEVNDGMLWPTGKASTNMANFTQLVNAGYDAAKSVFPGTKVIVHLSNGWDNSLFRWLFDGLKNNGGKWDVIGMSLYPGPANWASFNTQCFANMNDMVSRYSKEVMIVETGMSWDQSTAAKDFLTDLINKTKAVANNKGIGVLYWEPEAYGNWQGYSLGAFDYSGKPTIALNAFN